MKKIRKGYLVKYIDVVTDKQQRKNVNISLFGIWDGEKVVFNNKEQTTVRGQQWLEIVKGNIFMTFMFYIKNILSKIKNFNYKKFFTPLFLFIDFIFCVFIIVVPTTIHIYFLDKIYYANYVTDIYEIIYIYISSTYILFQFFYFALKFDTFFRKTLKI
jgi:cellulose synthase/poly-beta-1,6-N-acetylglucosamine synthase-like glycosyltransferase